MDNRDLHDDSRSNWTPSWGAGIALVLFLAIFLAGIGISVWQEVVVNNEDTLADTLIAISDTADGFGVIAGAVSFGFHEIWRFAVVFAKVLEDNRRQRIRAALEEGQAQGRAEGLEQGREEGRREERARANAEFNRVLGDWNRRRLEAQEQGVEFNEPPPFFPNGSDGYADDGNR